MKNKVIVHNKMGGMNMEKIVLNDVELKKVNETLFVMDEVANDFKYIRPVENEYLYGTNASTYSLSSDLLSDEKKSTVGKLKTVNVVYSFRNVELLIDNFNLLRLGGIDNRYHFSHHYYKHLRFILKGLKGGSLSEFRFMTEVKVLNKKVKDLKVLVS